MYAVLCQYMMTAEDGGQIGGIFGKQENTSVCILPRKHSK
jgi:hypothetical protein